MQYLNYESYRGLGGDIDEVQYPILERLASKKLDYWTLGRISTLSEISDDIRLCMKLIIEYMKEIDDMDKTKEGQISSFSNDGVSITYSNIKTSSEKESELYQQIIEILPVELVSICLD